MSDFFACISWQYTTTKNGKHDNKTRTLPNTWWSFLIDHGTGIILTPKSSYILFQQVSTLAGSATSLRFKSGCPGRTEDATNTHQQNFYWKKGNTANQTHLVSLPPKQVQIQTLPNLLSQKMWRSRPPDLAPKIGWHIIPARQHSRPVPVFRAIPWLCRVHTAIVSTLDLVLFQCEKLQQNISRINERIRSWVSFQSLVCWSVYHLQKMQMCKKLRWNLYCRNIQPEFFIRMLAPGIPTTTSALFPAAK